MKRSQPRSYRSAAGLAAFGCALICCPALAAPLVEQSLELRPGWNAVYLEVAPEPGDVASVFAGLPIGSVWTWIGRGSTVAFIQDPAEGLRDQPGWLGHFPAGRPESFLGNLAQMRGGQAYLVQLQGTQPRSWTVRGRPAPRPPEWAPNSFNLVGFPLDPAAPPTFSAFFAASAAHAGQAVYRLGTAGQWERLSDLSTQCGPARPFGSTPRAAPITAARLPRSRTALEAWTSAACSGSSSFASENGPETELRSACGALLRRTRLRSCTGPWWWSRIPRAQDTRGP